MAWIDDLYSRVNALDVVLAAKLNKLWANTGDKANLSPGLPNTNLVAAINAIAANSALTAGLHTTIAPNQVNVAFEVNTPVKDKSGKDRLIFGNTSATDVIIKGAVANGDFKVKDSTDADMFRMNGSNKVPYFPQLPAPQTGASNNLAIFDTGNGLWKSNVTIGDLALSSQIPTNYWTTNTTQTGLIGNKTTSGIITSTGGFVGALTGNASTATTLATARTINGTSFNGSANITTALWGTARNITIGNTTKSVNGSANVAWSLAEIGASSVNHTHNYITSRNGTGAYASNFGELYITSEMSPTDFISGSSSYLDSIQFGHNGGSKFKRVLYVLHGTDDILRYATSDTTGGNFTHHALANRDWVTQQTGNLPSLTTTNKNNLVEAINEVNGNITNVNDFGGVNLVDDSHFYNGNESGWSNVYGTQVVDNHILKKTFTSLSGAARIERVFSNLKAGVYTLTIFVKTPRNIDWSGFVNGTPITGLSLSSPTEFSRRSVTFTVPTDGNVTVRGYVNSIPVGSVIEIDWFKLETGYVGSDWTPTIEEQKSAWNETNPLKSSYIKNKPTIPTSSDYITTNTNQTGLSGNKTTTGLWTINSITVGHTAGVGGIYKGFSSSSPFSFLNSGNAQQVFSGGLLASNNYADGSLIPTNGIYSKGTITTAGHGNSSEWDSKVGNKGLYNTANTANTANPNSVTQWTVNTGGFFTSFGTSLHLKGNNDWYNRLDIPTGGTRIELWQGINSTTMTNKGFIPIVLTANTNIDSGNISTYIPTINNGQLTLSTGTGLSGSATFTANQAGGSTFSVAVASTHKLPTTAEWAAALVNTTYTAGNGLTLTGNQFSLPISIVGSGSFVQVVTQTPTGISVLLGTPPNTDTITRLRGTATGTYTSGDLTLLAGTNVSIVQSGANFTINATNTNTTYTSSNGILLTGTNFTPVYGTAANTIAQGNDSRILNGQTAFGWGNHAGLYALVSHTHTSNQVTALTGYTLGTNVAIGATDTLNVALGKIQAQINAKTNNTGTVTSVSSTVAGNALNVSVTSPTATPALAFTWGGNSSQYVRGDGSLATLPGGGGGGITNIRTDNSTMGGPTSSNMSINFASHESYGRPEADVKDDEVGNAVMQVTSGDYIRYYASFDSTFYAMPPTGTTYDIDLDELRRHIYNVIFRNQGGAGGTVRFGDGIYEGDQINVTVPRGQSINLQPINGNLISSSGQEVYTHANLIWNTEKGNWVLVSYE